jgi:hypothetical protein
MWKHAISNEIVWESQRLRESLPWFGNFLLEGAGERAKEEVLKSPLRKGLKRCRKESGSRVVHIFPQKNNSQRDALNGIGNQTD